MNFSPPKENPPRREGFPFRSIVSHQGSIVVRFAEETVLGEGSDQIGVELLGTVGTEVAPPVRVTLSFHPEPNSPLVPIPLDGGHGIDIRKFLVQLVNQFLDFHGGAALP